MCTVYCNELFHQLSQLNEGYRFPSFKNNPIHPIHYIHPIHPIYSFHKIFRIHKIYLVFPTPVCDQLEKTERDSREMEQWTLLVEQYWPLLITGPASLSTNCSPYLIFVISFTLANFEAWKFYTQKCVNSRQKLPRDKTA